MAHVTESPEFIAASNLFTMDTGGFDRKTLSGRIAGR